MIISLQLMYRPARRATWATEARATLSPEFLRELDAVYKPFAQGHIFLELPVDYDDHNDVLGFIDYVRTMDPVRFVFYLVGRILSLEEIAALGVTVDPIMDALRTSPYSGHCPCLKAPFEEILVDVPTFQNRLADLWQWFGMNFSAIDR
jgi:hypothetical protein